MNTEKLVLTLCLIATCCIHGFGQAYLYHHPLAEPVTAARFSPTLADALTCAANPAVIPLHKGVTGGLSAEKKFMLKELVSIAGAGTLNSESICVTLALHHFGSALHKEKNASLGLGKKLGGVNVGVKFFYQEWKTAGLYQESALSGSLSVVCKLAENVYSSAVISNPQYYFKSASANSLRQPQSVRIGLGYRPSLNFYAGIETEKESGRRAKLLLTVYHHLNATYAARAFWSTAGNQPYFGFTFRQHTFVIEAGCSYHFSLGISPCITISFQERRFK